MKKFIKWTLGPALGASLLLLQACGTTSVSNGITDDGRATEVVFPDIAKNTWLKEGTFVNLDNLRQIAPGNTKDQLYDLLGHPHFAEGSYGVREWDYIFNFRTGKGSEFTTCQYKVIFDKNALAQTFHWQPAACADRLKVATASALVPTPAVMERVVTVTPPPVKRIQLSADALFAFDKSDLGNMQKQGPGWSELEAALRNTSGIDRVLVVGHTDRLGSVAHNNVLSAARAKTMGEYLAGRGVPANRIRTVGNGSREPVVQCPSLPQAALIACLAPNRRVDVEIQGAP